MKRLSVLLALLFCILMVCGMAPQAEHMYILTGFKEHPDPHWKKVIVLEEGAELTFEMLPARMIYESNQGGYAIPVTWNVTDETLKTPGLHYVTGTPVLPDDASLAEGFHGIATWPVFCVGEDVTLTVTPKQPEIQDCLIAQNGSPAEELYIEESGKRCTIGEDGYLDLDETIIWNWDYSAINVSELGDYTITGTPTLPDWLTLPENYTVSFAVYVLPTDRIEIYGLMGIAADRLEIQWLYDCSSVTNTVLEYKTEDDQWIACDKTWYSFLNSYVPAKLSLYLLNIPVETEHILRLRYQDVVDGETIECITNPIRLTIPANISEQLGTPCNPPLLELDNGDRDGGDSGGTDLPDYEQPAPDSDMDSKDDTDTDTDIKDDTNTDIDNKNDVDTNVDNNINTDIKNNPDNDIHTNGEKDSDTKTDSKTESSQEQLFETVTDTYTAISGLRLQRLINSGSTVLFEKQGLSMEIPSSLLKALNLKNDDLLETTILHPQKNAVQIAVVAAGIPVNDLTGTMLYLPWDSSDGTKLECRDSAGDLYTEVVYQEATGLARFEIAAPGTYFVTVSSEAAVESDNHSLSTTNHPTHETTGNTVNSHVPSQNHKLLTILAIGFLAALLLVLHVLRRRCRHG